MRIKIQDNKRNKINREGDVFQNHAKTRGIYLTVKGKITSDNTDTSDVVEGEELQQQREHGQQHRGVRPTTGRTSPSLPNIVAVLLP
jgi:hypothetical protein